MNNRPRTTSFVDGSKSSSGPFGANMKISSKDGSKVMTVIALLPSFEEIFMLAAR